MKTSGIQFLKDVVSYNKKTGEITITWNETTVTHTAKGWILADTGNKLLKQDLDRHFNT